MDEDNSKHMISVLRMQKGEQVVLTNGKGSKAEAVIIDDHRKKCQLEISFVRSEEKIRPHIAIGISLIKNSSRFEWFL